MPVEEQGVNPDRYQVIPRCLIFIFNDQKVLLLKGAPTKKIWANKYNGIGGHIERGEDPLGAAVRELEEESGINHINLKLAGTILVDTGAPIGIGLFVFVGIYNNSELRFSDEGILEWIRMDELDKIPVVEDLPTIIPPAYQVLNGQPPFSAQYRYDAAGKMQILIH